VCEDEDEEPESAHTAGNGELADVGPVDLRLLADERLGAQEDLPPRTRADLCHVLAQRAHGATEAALAQPVVEARRAQGRIARERLGDEVVVRSRRVARGVAAARDPSSPRTRRTTSAWTPIWVEMVPTFQCSAKKRRAISAQVSGEGRVT
jgi:hypothetical protein